MPVYRLGVEARFCVYSPDGPEGRPLILRGLIGDERVAALIKRCGGAPESEWTDVHPDHVGDLPAHVRRWIADALDRVLAVDAEQRAQAVTA